jgi:murein L,D-transpeptidase YcbB/YkuD
MTVLRFVLILLCFISQLLVIGQAAGVVKKSNQEVAPVSIATVVEEPVYRDISDAIFFYQQLANLGPWPQIDDGPLLKTGSWDVQVPVLRRQLQLLGYSGLQPSSEADNDLFDSALYQALTAFQRRHGVKADGILGPVSKALLNVPPRQRLDQLLVNRNRQQSLEVTNSGRYIQVNIPEFRLRVYQQGEVLLEMKTIVGRKKRKTPIFNTEIQALVLNPSWSVPKSIAYKDIIPRWVKDPGYAGRLKLQVVSGKGQSRIVMPAADVDPALMYQGKNYPHFWEAPGEANTLGRIKFVSRSRYAIYLHDTSSRYLFSHEKRAFSSGCIRVERARELADLLLRHDTQEQRLLLDEKLATLKTGEVYLEQPVPVYVTYWTAWVDGSGVLNFRDDL